MAINSVPFIHCDTFNPFPFQQREEMTAHLKDQLQEVKAKTGLERKYVKSSADLLVYQGQKLNAHSEKKLADEIRVCDL